MGKFYGRKLPFGMAEKGDSDANDRTKWKKNGRVAGTRVRCWQVEKERERTNQRSGEQHEVDESFL